MNNLLIPIFSRREGTLPAIVISLLATMPATGQAAEWKIDPTIRLRAGYNDNIRLTTRNEQSSSEITFSPGAVFSVETPRSGLSGDLRFTIRRFLDESNLNDNNVRLGIDSFHRMERSEVGLGLDLIRDTTLDSQLEETGVVFGRVNRFLKRASPRWSYNLSERTRLDTNYSFTDVSYAKSSSGFVDYTSHNARLSVNRVVNERLFATATLGSTLTNNDNDVQSTYSYLQGGASYQFSEASSASLFVGLRRTGSEFKRRVPIFAGQRLIGFSPVSSKVENSSSGSVFNGTLSKQFERGSTALTLSRDVSNTVSGILFEVTRLTWKNSYRFSETLTGAFDLSLYRSTDDSDVAGGQDRKYYDLNPRISWRFARFWSLSASYRYRNQTFDSSNDDATQNVANLTLTYHWPRIAVSR